VVSHNDVMAFLDDPQLDRELAEAQDRRTAALVAVCDAFPRADAAFLAARRPVFRQWRLECREADAHHVQRKLADPRIACFPGMADLLRAGAAV
jgi:hypothetical protein